MNSIWDIKIGKYIVRARKPLWWAIIGFTGAVIIGGAYCWMLAISIGVGVI